MNNTIEPPLVARSSGVRASSIAPARDAVPASANRPEAKEIDLLVVEDNPGDARLIRESLTDVPSPGFRLHEAGTLSEAVRWLETNRPDLVLLDLTLPDASGLEGVERLRAQVPDIPIIVLTGVDDDALAVRALRQGAYRFLLKGDGLLPLLPRILRYALERRHVERDEAFISGLSGRLTASLSLRETLDRLGELAVSYLAEYSVIISAEPDAGEPLALTARSPDDAALLEVFASTAGPSAVQRLAGRAFSANAPTLLTWEPGGGLGDLDPEPRAIARSMGVRSGLALPMRAHDRTVGVIVLLSARTLSEEDLAFGLRFAESGAEAVDNARLFDRCEDAVRARDRVLGAVAHDLRNPLSTISMVTELLLAGTLTDDQEKTQLEILQRSARHMNRLIEDLLDVTRLEEGHLDLRRSYASPARLVQDVLERNQSIAVASGVELVDHIGRAGPVHVDADRILRVLTNLIANAIRFTPRGGRVTVGTRNEGRDEVVFYVEDTGPGIPEIDLPLLFRPFWQGDDHRGGGLGLGLSIARGIVDAHRGRIWAENRPAGGARVSFALPRAAERRSAAGTTGPGAAAMVLEYEAESNIAEPERFPSPRS